MEQEVIYVGIDVAKAQVDVAVRPTGDRWEVSYDDAGVGKLVTSPAASTLQPTGTSQKSAHHPIASRS